MALESKTHKRVELGVFETRNPNKSGNIPEYARVHVLDGFSILMKEGLNLKPPSMMVKNPNGVRTSVVNTSQTWSTPVNSGQR